METGPGNSRPAVNADVAVTWPASGIAALGLVLVLAAACANAAGTRTPERNPDVIRADEFAGLTLNTAFDVVERLRPQFLRPRGATSAFLDTRISVFQDDLLLGGVDMLRQIRSADVQEVRFLKASDATTRFGSGHPNGVIVVTSRAR